MEGVLSRLLRWRWKLDSKEAAVAGLALGQDPPTMGLNDTLHDGQTQSAAIGADIESAVESLKDVRPIVGVNTGAIVPHPETDSLSGLFSTDLDLATHRHKLDCVVEEIAQRQLDASAIAEDR